MTKVQDTEQKKRFRAKHAEYLQLSLATLERRCTEVVPRRWALLSDDNAALVMAYISNLTSEAYRQRRQDYWNMGYQLFGVLHGEDDAGRVVVVGVRGEYRADELSALMQAAAPDVNGGMGLVDALNKHDPKVQNLPSVSFDVQLDADEFAELARGFGVDVPDANEDGDA